MDYYYYHSHPKVSSSCRLQMDYECIRIAFVGSGDTLHGDLIKFWLSMNSGSLSDQGIYSKLFWLEDGTYFQVNIHKIFDKKVMRDFSYDAVVYLGDGSVNIDKWLEIMEGFESEHCIHIVLKTNDELDLQLDMVTHNLDLENPFSMKNTLAKITLDSVVAQRSSGIKPLSSSSPNPQTKSSNPNPILMKSMSGLLVMPEESPEESRSGFDLTPDELRRVEGCGCTIS